MLLLWTIAYNVVRLSTTCPRKCLSWSLINSIKQPYRHHMCSCKNSESLCLNPLSAVVCGYYGGLNGPTKSSPHFWNSSNDNTGWCVIRACFVGCPNHWHRSHSLQYRTTSLRVVDHHNPLCHIFQAVASSA